MRNVHWIRKGGGLMFEKINAWFDVFFQETMEELKVLEQKFEENNKKLDEKFDKLLTDD